MEGEICIVDDLRTVFRSMDTFALAHDEGGQLRLLDGGVAVLVDGAAVYLHETYCNVVAGGRSVALCRCSRADGRFGCK